MSDSPRQEIRKKLDPLYLPLYDTLCDNLKSWWQPYCGWRSIGAQDEMYARGRPPGAGDIVTQARGGQSGHNYGLATDWTTLDHRGHFDWPDYDDPIWDQYIGACEKVGLRTLSRERHHNEIPIVVKWKEVDLIRREHGMNEAMAFVARKRRM